MGRRLGQHALDVWVTLGDMQFEDARVVDHGEVWQQRGGICPMKHFAVGGSSVPHSTSVLCHVTTSCIPES